MAVSAFAQNAPPPQDNGGGWPRADSSTAAPPSNDPVYADQGPQQGPGPNGPQPGYGPQGPNQGPNGPYPNQGGYQNQGYQTQSYPVPAQITIKPGTYVTVRLNQFLSSDKNQPGDPFTATLAKPIVVDGVVVAEPGQTVSGRVSDAEKAGRVKGVSKLGLQLTELSLVDGQQLPVQSPLVQRVGNTSVGRDAFGIGATTATGAAIGAGVNGGVGAGVGAAAGLVVGIAGVLLTRDQPTILPPETLLTFRIDSPVSFSTEHSQQAFRYIEPGEYAQPSGGYRAGMGPQGPPPAPYYAGGYYAAPYPYYYGGYYPYYYGPSIGIGFGYGFYGRGYYGGRYYGGYRGVYRGRR